MKFLALLTLLVSTQIFAGFSVSTYNIRNFDNDYQAGATNVVELEKIIKSVKSDVMAFEEVVNLQAFQDVVKRNLTGYQISSSSCGGMGKQNLAVVFNTKTFEFVSQSEDLSYSGAGNSSCGSLRPVLFVTLKQKASGKNYIFAVVHLKAGGDQRAFSQRWVQYKRLENMAIEFKNENLIILGDFNTTGYNIKNQDYAKFESFISTAGLRTTSENIGCTNYWDGADQDPNYLPSILDHIVVQDKNVSSIESVKLGAHCMKNSCRPALAQDLGVTFEAVSDHCPVQVTFK